MSTGTLSHKLFRTSVEKGLAPRQFKFVISSESVDRDRDIIKLDAWDFREYMTNPVVLASHDHQRLPVGKSVDIGVRGDKLKATVEFPPKGIYDYADMVHDLVEAGFLKAASVGFRATDSEPNGLGGMTIKKATLLEWSICSIGSTRTRWSNDVRHS
jgi:HK97 family phage prohead protease